MREPADAAVVRALRAAPLARACAADPLGLLALSAPADRAVREGRTATARAGLACVRDPPLSTSRAPPVAVTVTIAVPASSFAARDAAPGLPIAIPDAAAAPPAWPPLPACAKIRASIALAARAGNGGVRAGHAGSRSPRGCV